MKKTKPKILVEIGTATGGSLFLLSQMAANDATLISVELPSDAYMGGYSKWKMPLYRSFAKPGQEIHLIVGDPHKQETLGRVRDALKGREIDFLFVDGDHSYDATKKEFDMYSPLVGKNGMIAFHDIAGHPFKTRRGVDAFWNEIKRRYAHTEIVEDRGQEWAGIGIILKRPGRFI